jgi:hypothetical protein
MGAETYDVDLGHSGRKIARNPGGEQGARLRSGRSFLDGISEAIDNITI